MEDVTIILFWVVGASLLIIVPALAWFIWSFAESEVAHQFDMIEWCAEEEKRAEAEAERERREEIAAIVREELQKAVRQGALTLEGVKVYDPRERG